MSGPIFKSTRPDLDIPACTVQELIFKDIMTHPRKAETAFHDVTGRKYSFLEVFGASRKVAAGFAAKGLTKGGVVAIFSPNLPEYPIALHGLGWLGAIATTANPLYTAEEFSHQLKDSSAEYIITIPMFLEKAQAAAAKVEGQIKEIIVFGEAEGATPFASLLANDGNFEAPTIDAKEDPFILPYSSGTTGKPKGVVLTHYNLASNILQVLAMETDLLDEDVLLGVLPFFHIYGIILIMNLALMRKIKVVVMPRFDLPTYLKLVQEHKVTHLHVVPPIALALAKHPVIDKFDMSSVRVVFSGAAPLGGAIESALSARLGCVVKQAYGMTELSPGANITPTAALRPGSVGLTVPNMELIVVDTASGERLDVKGVGELCYRGPNVMKEYLNRPEATKSTIDSEGFLHTGDIGYIDEDGYVFIVDRVKELIKYKGYQVAPAELEELLQKHEDLVDAAVIGKPDEEAGELPKAFVVKKEGSSITAEDIVKYIEDQVAPHKKLRGGVEFVDAIPKSLSGKILRRELKAREVSGDKSATTLGLKVQIGMTVNKAAAAVFAKFANFASADIYPPGVTVTDVTGFPGIGAKRTLNNLGEAGSKIRQQLIAADPENYTSVLAYLSHPKPQIVGGYLKTQVLPSIIGDTPSSYVQFTLFYPGFPKSVAPNVIQAFTPLLQYIKSQLEA
eukprot:TRINITY_DN1245_c0_g1_i1.p1 TRINITY_DN1245_c0_g1~~TRINITY_DN1245_c0_g1_i1.p1  ORF type:complete len:685 (+),score=224.45 TRINITY_DN1245_c0_g1_i1:23-2056(+)